MSMFSLFDMIFFIYWENSTKYLGHDFYKWAIFEIIASPPSGAKKEKLASGLWLLFEEIR